MAEKTATIKVKNTDNTYDTIYPTTTKQQVLGYEDCGFAFGTLNASASQTVIYVGANTRLYTKIPVEENRAVTIAPDEYNNVENYILLQNTNNSGKVTVTIQSAATIIGASIFELSGGESIEVSLLYFSESEELIITNSGIL